jgi:choline dehydrogenase-like flavoprotein
MTKFPTSKAVDFVVVGAGAAGAIVAKELAVAGFQVVVLEQGPYFKNAEFGHHDELTARASWDKPQIWNPTGCIPENQFRESASSFQ